MKKVTCIPQELMNEIQKATDEGYPHILKEHSTLERCSHCGHIVVYFGDYDQE